MEDVKNVWHRCVDNQPEISDYYIVSFSNGNVFVAFYSKRTDRWYDVNLKEFEEVEVTAWREFPDAPKFD